MAEKFIKLVSGVPNEQEALQTSAGVPDAGKVVALNEQGDIDQSMLPPGVAPDIASIECSENLTAGDFVNIYDDAATAKCRRADATTAGKHAQGFVISGFSTGQMASVFFEGVNNAVSGHTAGDVYLDTTPGAATSTPPSSAGNIVQKLGVASAATAINVEFAQHYVLA